MVRSLVVLGALAVLLTAPALALADVDKWIYYSGGCSTEESTNEAIAMMERAKEAGYTHFLFDDVYIQLAYDMPESYFRNTARAREAAERIGIEVVPNIFQVGYSWRILYYDSNLAAGLPARNVPFKVSDGLATPDPAGAPRIVNPGFNDSGGGVLAGWATDETSAPCVTIDTENKVEGNASLRMGNFDRLPGGSGNVSVTQVVTVEPFQNYRLTIKRKTEGVEARGSTLWVGSADGRQRLSWTNFEVDPEQNWLDTVARDSDWTEFQLNFNTLDTTSMLIRVGMAGASEGTVWWDDLKLEPAGLCNLLRSPTKPFIVTSADGSIVYLEGIDFEPVVDPKMGNRPMPDWLSALPRPGGSFSIWHEGPPITLTADSRISDGDTILVSYFHPHTIYGHQISNTLEDPKVFEVFDKQMQTLKRLWPDSKTLFLGYDEVRTGGWEIQLDGQNLTPGELLARHFRTAYDIARHHMPDARIVTWSDMFDPHHNADRRERTGGRYYLCNGNFWGAWEGVPKDVVIMKWGMRPAGIQWFGREGWGQILSAWGGSTAPPDSREQADAARAAVQRAMEGAGPHGDSVVGFMYTTWTQNFNGLEAYSRAIDEYMAANR